ncbi:MAG TPA: VWA domain-containing protein [Bryobacteraceae bacterium]|nr:VWA domain-containing protein [Bryobacteraceae bacterium]
MHSRRQFLVSAAGLALAGLRASAQEPVFSTNVQVVNILATVRTRKGEIVRDLTQDDFVLLEDGRPQKIQYFTRDTDLPLTIGLLVDTSMSQVRLLPAERSASGRFLDQILRVKKDQVFISQFDITVQTRQRLTNSWFDLTDALAQVDTPTRKQLESDPYRGTLLYDAVVQASEDVMAKQTGRKALVIMTDGVDYGSEGTLLDSIEAAHRASTLVYSIYFSDEGGDGKSVLSSMAKETGGAFYEVSKKQTLDRIFDMIQEDLRSQYSLGFVSDRPTEVSQFRKLQLTVKRPGLVVQARDRYWAGGHS